MMQYLGIIEQRTNEILQMYAASQAASAGQDPGTMQAGRDTGERIPYVAHIRIQNPYVNRIRAAQPLHTKNRPCPDPHRELDTDLFACGAGELTQRMEARAGALKPHTRL